jgi:hypothetical protein
MYVTVIYRTCNFRRGFHELSYTLSLRFIVVTIMVLELRILGVFTIGQNYACNSFLGVFYNIRYRNLQILMRFFLVKLHIEFTFHRHDHYGSRVPCFLGFL